MSTYFHSLPHWTMRALAAAVVLCTPIEAVAWCFVEVSLYNYERRVPGHVNAECSECHYSGCGKKKSKYQSGFGNWGVASQYGEIRDTDQFAGWYDEDDKLQWQSCTKKLPKPDCLAYNDNHCTGQKTVPENKRRYGGYSYFLRPYGTLCNAIGVETVEEIDMHLYELDWPDSDELVASLVYGDVSVALTCTSAYRCSGESAWISATSGGGTVKAKARVEVKTRFWESR